MFRKVSYAAEQTKSTSFTHVNSKFNKSVLRTVRRWRECGLLVCTGPPIRGLESAEKSSWHLTQKDNAVFALQNSPDASLHPSAFLLFFCFSAAALCCTFLGNFQTSVTSDKFTISSNSGVTSQWKGWKHSYPGRSCNTPHPCLSFSFSVKPTF